MANQRMYMVCEICSSKEETTLEECMQYLTKYYPNTGWMDERMIENIKKFFAAHDHRTQDGKYARICYDSEFDSFAKSRDEITAIVGEALHQATHK